MTHGLQKPAKRKGKRGQPTKINRSTQSEKKEKLF